LGGSHLHTCRLSCRGGSLYLGRGRVQRIGGTGYGSRVGVVIGRLVGGSISGVIGCLGTCRAHAGGVQVQRGADRAGRVRVGRLGVDPQVRGHPFIDATGHGIAPITLQALALVVDYKSFAVGTKVAGTGVAQRPVLAGDKEAVAVDGQVQTVFGVVDIALSKDL